MFPDLSPLPPSEEPQNEPTRDWFADCPAGQCEPLCSARIHPECLSTDANGVVRVSLAVSSALWFEFLARLGDVIHLSRTPVAVLANDGPAPVVVNHENSVLPQSECGLFSPNLAEFTSLWAVREIFPDGPLYFLEVRDALGRPSQRIVIPPGEARWMLREFVCTYQSPSGFCRPWFPPNHARSAQRHAGLVGRIPWLRQRLKNGGRQVRALERYQAEHLLVRAVEQGQRLRTILYNRSLISGAIWTPEMRDPPIAGCLASENVARFFGDGTGLELHRSCPSSAWLWTGQCSCCGEEKWAVEIGGPEDELALAFTVPDETGEIAWRTFLQELFKP